MEKEGCYRPTVQMRPLRPPRAQSKSASSGWMPGLNSRALSAPPSHCPPKEAHRASRRGGREGWDGVRSPDLACFVDSSQLALPSCPEWRLKKLRGGEVRLGEKLELAKTTHTLFLMARP